jgi:hypothetical protein
MSKSDLLALLVLSNGVWCTITFTLGVLWIRARERAIRAGADTQPVKVKAKEMPEIEHLMNAVDAIAVEVERISEAQRFTTKVLVERNENAAAVKRAIGTPERVITPH